MPAISPDIVSSAMPDGRVFRLDLGKKRASRRQASRIAERMLDRELRPMQTLESESKAAFAISYAAGSRAPEAKFPSSPASRRRRLVIPRTLAQELEKLSGYVINWDGYGAPAPSRQSISHSRELILQAIASGIEPRTVVPSAEGGTATYFLAPRKTCYVEYRNDGADVLVMYSDDDDDSTIVPLLASDRHLSRKYALTSISEYLSA